MIMKITLRNLEWSFRCPLRKQLRIWYPRQRFRHYLQYFAIRTKASCLAAFLAANIIARRAELFCDCVGIHRATKVSFHPHCTLSQPSHSRPSPNSLPIFGPPWKIETRLAATRSTKTIGYKQHSNMCAVGTWYNQDYASNIVPARTSTKTFRGLVVFTLL